MQALIKLFKEAIANGPSAKIAISDITSITGPDWLPAAKRAADNQLLNVDVHPRDPSQALITR